MARHGLGHTLNTLHPAIHWTGMRIELTGSDARAYDLSAGPVVVPSMLGCPRLATQLDDVENAAVQYPLWGRVAPSGRAGPRSCATWTSRGRRPSSAGDTG
ncbi:hypothetical protein GCM10027610_044100 [Dactylosporangium cerinum]